MRNREAGDGHSRRRAPLDVKDSARVVAANREFFGAWTGNSQVIGDVQLAAVEGNGPVKLRREGNLVGARGSVGVENGLTQRTRATIARVADRQDRRGCGCYSNRYQYEEYNFGHGYVEHC